MFKDRVTRALHHHKAYKPVIQVGPPADSDGVNGDIRICQIERFIFLCVKYANKWYNAATGMRVGAENTTMAATSGETMRTGSGGSTSGGARGSRRRGSLSSLVVAPFSYDSGWVAGNHNSDVTFTHNLGLTDVPSSIVVYASDNASPTLGTNTIVTVDTQNASDGVIIEITSKDVVELHIGATKLWDSGTFGDSSVPASITDGYIRVLIKR